MATKFGGQILATKFGFVPDWWASIRLDNGLAPGRWQAIIWTKDGLVIDAYMHHSGPMSKTLKVPWNYMTPHVTSRITSSGGW